MCFNFRIIGYAACTGIGFLLSLMGTLVLFGGTNSTNIRTFAVLYVLGNVIGKILFVFQIEHNELFHDIFHFLNITSVVCDGFLAGS